MRYTIIQITTFFFVILNITFAIAQDKDTLYVQEYPHKWWVKAFIPNKMLTILHDKEIYNPTYPQNIGVGVGLRKIIGMNLLVSFSVFPLKTDTDLSSSITDFQMHKYGKKLLLDGYYQDYRGFFTQREQDGKKVYTLFPNLTVKRWGLDGTYVLRNKRFSLRAAFEQSEKQIKSAGSLLLGSGFYYHKIVPDASQQQSLPKAFDNYQIGANIGYAYSWVVSPRWLLAGMVSAGVNFGNNSEVLAWHNLRAYPASIGRLTLNYNREDWSFALTGIFNNKTVYSPQCTIFCLACSYYTIYNYPTYKITTDKK